MTKLELELKVKKLEEEIASLEEAKQLESQVEKLRKEVHQANQKNHQMLSEMTHHKKSHEEASKRYNILANIFDEYIKASDDIVETNKLFLRNILRTQELMRIKIQAFNGEGEGVKK
jgi:CTP-dependent riboflavin kinase